MPDMDGVTLANEIADCMEKTGEIPMIMLTSLGLRELDTAGVKFAADLTNPIKPGRCMLPCLKYSKNGPP
jgi:CheY-like chemotaxis protein